MSDDTPTDEAQDANEAGATGDSQAVPPSSSTDEQGSEDEEFDKDRALKTIRQLRTFEKQSKQLARKVEEFERREREAQQAQLSDQEKLAKRLADLEAQSKDRDRQHQERVNRYEVQLAAQRHGVVDSDAAVKLLDWSALEYGDDGRPVNVEEALADLIKERPYLAAQQSQTPPARAAATNPPSRSAAATKRTYAQAELRDRAFYLEHREDIDAAYREGRITA